ADVKDVAGTWKDLTDSVNSMAGNLTGQVRNIAEVTTAVANADWSKKITVDVKGEILELKDTINTMVDQLRSFASEVTRVAREVGTEGKLGGQADVKDVAGTWKDLTDSVNFMAGNLTGQVRNIADVTKAVANGDLSKKITVDVKGEILELKNTVNTMVDQLSSFAAEVTRVAREVGTEGKLGGQAQVKGVSGTWKDLTDNVNFMAGNLTSQVRGIAKVVTSVANGDLKKKLTVKAKGEIAALADTINGMIDTLALFADQVTTVAREVGVEGKLGGQASVPGAAGTWKDLTDNVNQLAANLTTQVRAIAEVATAVTKGDLTRSIKVEALGEVAALKDNINEMIRNLKDTTLKNSEQDWLKTNLAKFSRMLQGQRDLLTVGRLILSELAPVVSAQHAVFYTLDATTEPSSMKLLASYAYEHPNATGQRLALGQGLVGQCALEKQKIVLQNVPPGYVRISSGLGNATPMNLIVLPVVFEGEVKAVLELASFDVFNSTHQAFLDQLMESIGIVLNTIEANMRTQDLLEQSQSLAKELQNRQLELQRTNEELQQRGHMLAYQNAEVERKNREVEQARQALQERAQQLALTSKYKSEFLANMSHELRTPLNSLLILSDQLSKNLDGNLTPKQTEYCNTIHSSGNDLLMLINDILDLSKIESGTVVVDIGELRFSDLQDYLERTFRHVAESKGIGFSIDLASELPSAIFTDSKRLQQVVKNLLSNAFKFTHDGEVRLSVQTVTGGQFETESLQNANMVLAISVSDTGIGIPPDKQRIIFEAFQQADGSTSRKYGGTGLGLAISREIARLLGGEIRLKSQLEVGSTFTLLLPQAYVPVKTAKKPGPTLSEMEAAMVVMSVEDKLPSSTSSELSIVNIPDDRESLTLGGKVLLIVDNDISFAQFLLESAQSRGFKGVITTSGATAIALACEYQPSAITLDISLPDIDGWRVLDRLKHDPLTRHIPVTIISTEDQLERGVKRGAIGYLGKPIRTQDILLDALDEIHDLVENDAKLLVLVHRDAQRRAELAEWLGGDMVTVAAFESRQEAMQLLEEQEVDCVVLQGGASEVSVSEFTEALSCSSQLRHTPCIVFFDEGAMSDPLELARVERHRSCSSARTLEQLIDLTALYLHQPVAALPEAQQRVVARIHDDNSMLAGKTVLIVDDDIRNIFALTSVLERQQMVIISAETGRSAINILQSNVHIDLVLMDIMMPELDGMDTMREIRRIPHLKHLPIIAVTAKAMKGDREKCIEAGAWDYLSKPVDTEQMLAVLRAWLHD
ncbi:MAG: response regulator, partial [Aureliella sp.]